MSNKFTWNQITYNIVPIVLILIGMEVEDKDVFSYDDEVITNGWLRLFSFNIAEMQVHTKGF